MRKLSLILPLILLAINCFGAGLTVSSLNGDATNLTEYASVTNKAIAQPAGGATNVVAIGSDGKEIGVPATSFGGGGGGGVTSFATTNGTSIVIGSVGVIKTNYVVSGSGGGGVSVASSAVAGGINLGINVSGGLTGDVTGFGVVNSILSTVVGINGTSLAGLGTGLLKNTTGTGVPSIATAGTDYLTPTGNGSGLTALNGSAVASGTVAANRLPVATTSSLGVVQPDGTSITISGGVISAPGAGGGTITALTGDVSASGSGSVVATVLGAHGILYASLGTGILKNTTGTGVPSIAVAADFPTLNQSTTGNASTATTATAANALNSATTTVVVNGATAPTSGQVLTATSGTAAGWATPSSGGITALTGDVSASGSGSVVATLNNIPTGTTMAGSLLDTAMVAPSTPASGKGQIYEDSTSKNIAIKNDAGAINHGVQTRTVTTHQWISAIADDGSSTASQPAFTDISGTATATQLPIATAGALGVVQVGSGLAVSGGGVLSTSGGSGIAATAFNLSSVQQTFRFGGFQQTNWVFLSGIAPGTAAGVIADFDTNGLMDFALPRATLGFLIFTNSGLANNFNMDLGGGPAFVSGGSGTVTCLCVGDVNGDGRPDIIMLSASVVQVWTNSGPNASGQISFVQLGSNYTVSTGTGLYAADFNGDGSIDFIVSSSGANATEWTNNGVGIFVQNTAATFPTAARSSLLGCMGHFMGTTNWDICLDVATPSGVLLLTNAGNGLFSISTTNLHVTVNGSLATNDFNGDGLLDVVVNEASSSKVQVMTNNGAGVLGDYSTNAVPGSGGSIYPIASADFNMDGRADILSPNSTGGYVILTNSGIAGAGAFSGMLTNLPAATTVIPFVGDFNADGRPDIAFIGLEAGNFGVIDNLNLPIINGFLSGDGTNIVNGNISVSYSSSPVASGSAWVPGFVNFGNLSISTNYPPYVAAFAPVSQIGNGLNLTNIFHVTVSAATSGTVTADNTHQCETTYLSSGSTIVSITVALPTATTLGRFFYIHSKSAVTTLTVTGGSFIDTGVVAMTAGQTIAYQTIDGAGTYMRMQ